MDHNTTEVFGVDLAKNVFQVCWTDKKTGEIHNRQMSRSTFSRFFVNRREAIIGMEACGGAHYWAREFSKLGHEVVLMPGRDVKAYNPGNKNDAADAKAIRAAVLSGTTRRVTIKTQEQQAVLAVHKIRSQKMQQRIANTNQIRGLLMEFGVVAPQGHRKLMNQFPMMIEQIKEEVPPMLIMLLRQQYEEVKRLESQIAEVEEQLKAWSKQNEACERLQTITGVGLLTATSVVATIGEAGEFKNGRQLAAYFGLVPKNTGSGGKTLNQGMSKRGNRYIRTLLMEGARSVLMKAKVKPKIVSRLQKKKVHSNRIAGALAHKLARVIWAVLRKKTVYRSDYETAFLAI